MLSNAGMFRELENSCNKEQTKIIEKAMEWRKSSIVIICYLKILRLMVINIVIKTGETYNLSQDFEKNRKK